MESPTSFSDRFVSGYSQNFPPQVLYQVEQREALVATSSYRFRHSRSNILQDFLGGQEHNPEFSKALMAEQIVNLALQPLLVPRGFNSKLAPQSLECGKKDEKGVDLIICDDNQKAYLGIDVKLRKKKIDLGFDHFGWKASLKAPYIHLCLGNWVIDTREEEGVLVRDWITNYAIPKIPNFGKIPKINLFRQFIVERIGNSLRHYAENFKSIHKPEDQQIFKDKLDTMRQLFLGLKNTS